MENILKNESGVTLTVLVITVITMMVLIGATIINITGNEDIVNQTRYAVKKADEKSIIDDIQIVVTQLAQQWDGNDTIQGYIINKIRSKGEEGYKTENEGTIKIDQNGFITYYDKDDNIIEIENGEMSLKVDENGKVIKVPVE